MFPDEILLTIFSFLSFQDKIESVSFVSHRFRRIVKPILSNSFFVRFIYGNMSDEELNKHRNNTENTIGAIFWCCIHDDKIKLKKLLTLNHKVDLVNRAYPYAFYLMCAIGKEDIVKMFIEEGAATYRPIRRRIFSEYTFEDILTYKKSISWFNISLNTIYEKKESETKMISMKDFLTNYKF
jgi:hypothetical protein